MINRLSTFARAGVVTLALTGITGGVGAAPLAPTAPQVPAAAAETGAHAQLVSDRTIWRRNGGRNWNGGGRWNGNGHWNGNRYWRGNRNWNGNRYWRGRGGYYGGFYGSGLYLGFGGPIYAQPYYYEPRRAYRAGNAHVEWCYARYRSYRSWDNTFQPYHGPRQQCYSPYS